MFRFEGHEVFGHDEHEHHKLALVEHKSKAEMMYIVCHDCKKSLRNLGRKCEVYSRVVGYLRPVEQWNPGKKEEFKKRVTFKT